MVDLPWCTCPMQNPPCQHLIKYGR
ncbi:hypothetical protein F0M21_13725 [Bacillus velezensis]|uniref:SWIM-type domain-containing protein n=1 Tax=Bacillus velezensis (strain DSM 23117 / BGSC 10A6 / LMG 26770 / FZB42) TaxID=326423 RepID=A0A4Y6A8A2_BACVZ|nr:hypothetical protein RZ52_13945 [Bacillus velezensis]KAF6548139.1 SWIM zinc finger family protein [Bacillus sp. EKM207B]KAF6549216.1 SWIM zinc finger family protein [Bacillus sp. EKM206B]KAF6556204.1 SWIM zinc finger family protein [Bacillus sp. EKM203B]MBL3611841.1 SWIM zinc finger family protein [Bacillus sp. RHFS18]MBO3651361.1 SWIM zinc finger family protein [Bacillus amyloliquefaciens]QDE58135.1 hypothetical protein RBAM_38835 [Bacillus velezensis FZB42]QWQ30259.1 SWIM zinc finger fa